MRLFLAAAAMAMLAACGSSTPAPGSLVAVKPITTPAEETRLIAVLSYASWCGSCKTLDPKVEAVRAAHSFEGVEFFALDYSAKDDEAYFTNADTLGVGDPLRVKFADGISTGRLYLIDLARDEIVAEINRDMDEAAIIAAIESAANA